jgi:antitoxin PrlF
VSYFKINQINQKNQILLNIQNTEQGSVWAMSKKSTTDDKNKETNCCKVESLISVDERGQMVLPKELRDRAGIRSGDKLALVSWVKEGKICCFTLIKAEDLAVGVKDFLGPIMNMQNVE